MYLDLGRWITGSAWCSSGWTLGLPTPGLIFSAAALISLHLKGTWETQNHQTFCVSRACIIHTNLQSCMSIISDTPRSIFLSHLKRASQIPSYQILGTWGLKDRSQCMKLVLVSFTLFYSATCALILSVINIVSHICAGYMCFVKL